MLRGNPFLFPFMPPDDLEIYKPVTNLRKVDGGYTIATPKSLLNYLSNLALGGFAHGGRDAEGNILLIAGAFDAAVPIDVLEPSYAAITGEYLDGTPFEKIGSKRQYRRTVFETDAILHGLLTSDDGAMSTFAQLQIEHPIYACLKGGYLGTKTSSGLGRILKAWTLPCSEVDSIILSRLIALAEYDNDMVERVKAYFAEASKNGASRLEVLDTAIQKTQAALRKLSRTIVALTKQDKENEDTEEEEIQLDSDDPIVKEHRKLYITWIEPVAARDDVALFWRSDPTTTDATACWSEEEEAALRSLYPDRPQIELLQAIPNKTPGQIKKRARELGVKRDRWHIEEQQRFYWTVCFADLQAVTQFAGTPQERDFLYNEVNRMAQQTKRGSLTAVWFLPLDVVSFTHALCVTNENEDRLSPGCH